MEGPGGALPGHRRAIARRAERLCAAVAQRAQGRGRAERRSARRGRACAQRARQLRRSRNAAPLCARSALTSAARRSRAERAPAGAANAKTTRGRCWRPGARRMPRGGASDGPATAAGKRRSVPAPTGAGCWRGAERATRGTRPKAADWCMRLRTSKGVPESALAHRRRPGARTWNF